MEKKRNCSFIGAISPLFHNIFYLLLDFHVKAGTRFSLRDKRLFEISAVEIMRVNCRMKEVTVCVIIDDKLRLVTQRCLYAAFYLFIYFLDKLTSRGLSMSSKLG